LYILLVYKLVKTQVDTAFNKNEWLLNFKDSVVVLKAHVRMHLLLEQATSTPIAQKDKVVCEKSFHNLMTM